MVAMDSAVRSGLWVVETKPQVMIRSFREVLAEPHPHEGGLVADLESLDLEMVLGMAEAGVPGFVGEAHVLRDLVEHPAVEPGILAGHARFELRPPADCAIHEEVELHGRTLAQGGTAFQS